ncbi:unnamed protein product [Moneuplotes crassus]|uniref:Uncharacterized protein n=1 Tax=Euplotes crassus TaxID=5936 RepID=A0AAD1XRB1_EUPCR|nr:unnamed protein product [Moneuplotes crassus]
MIPSHSIKVTRSCKRLKPRRGINLADLLNDLDIENKENSFENAPHIKKELFMVLDVVDPQFNFQNELSNSQLLIFGEGMMKVHFFNYTFKDPTNPRKKHSIKKQIRYFLKKMRAYVAPTDIDIINPTFWLNMNEAQMHGEGTESGDNIGMENLLRKIMEIEKFTLNFDLSNKDFSSFTRPLLTIEIKIQNSLSTFSPTNWWHLVFVLKSILFATGEESLEKIQKEELCEAELKEIKIDRLREMIQEKLQRMTRSNEMANRPIVDKKILIDINKGCLELFDDNKKFSNVDLDGLNASFLVYNSKETKFDVDFKKLLIQNEMDEKTDEYRWVLFPGLVESRRENIIHMLKIRIRDKLVVVKKAQWKVFDQFEIFLDTMTVKLTRNFYRKIQKFLLYKEEKKKRAENHSMQDDKKINMLMPSRDMNNLESIEEMKSYQNFDERLEFSADSSGTPGIVTYNPEEQKNMYDSSIDELSGESSDEDAIMESTTQAFRDMERRLAQMTPRETEKKPKKTILGDLGSAIAKPFKTVRNIKSREKKEKSTALPVFFRYFSINEICVVLTYKHSESSWLNTKNLRITIKPFIKNAKFMTFARMLAKYEKFCKKNLIKQLPSIIKQKILKISMNIEDDDDDINDLNPNSAEYKTKRAKNIIFGRYAELC